MEPLAYFSLALVTMALEEYGQITIMPGDIFNWSKYLQNDLHESL